MKTIKNTPFPSGPQDPLARPGVLERLARSARDPDTGLQGAHHTLAQTISGPRAGYDAELEQLALAARSDRRKLPPDFPKAVADVLESLPPAPLWTEGLAESTWAIQAWARAVLRTEATPQEFASVFADVTRQALEAKEFDIAREMFQGLDQLRAAASLLSRGGEVHLAQRQSGDPRALENKEGLFETVRLGAVAGGANLLEACARLRGEVSELSGHLASSRHPAGGHFVFALANLGKELDGVQSMLERRQRALEAASGTPEARASLSDHILGCCGALDRLQLGLQNVVGPARAIAAKPEPTTPGPGSLGELLEHVDLSTARAVRVVDTTESRGMLSAAALELSDAKGTSFWLRCSFLYQDPTRPEIFANFRDEVLDLSPGPAAARLRDLLHRVRPVGPAATLEAQRCFQVFDAAMQLIDPGGIGPAPRGGGLKTDPAGARA